MSTSEPIEPIEPITIEATIDPPEETAAVPEPVAAAPASVSVAQLRSVQADSTISTHVALAVGTGFIPVPIFDVVATTGVQADMLWHLFRIYDQEISKERARSVVTVLLGASLPSLTARTVASGLKMIPGVGSALGFFTAPSLAGTSTYVVGKVVQEHLAGGGTLLDLQLSKAKAKVSEELGKIKTKSGETVHMIKTKSVEAVDEGKQRVGNAVAALRGKKYPPVPVEEPAGAAS